MSYPNKQDVAFVRLHALVQRGYQPDLGTKGDTNLIRLEHPRGAAAGAPGLLLCSDGNLIGIDNKRPLNIGEGDPDCIYADSDSDWQAFVSSVPALTAWEALIISLLPKI